MSYNQQAQPYQQQNFGRTQGSGFGMRNTQSSQFGQQSFNQPRIGINENFLSSQVGGMLHRELQPQRSQQDFNPGLSNAFRQKLRAGTPDNMQFNQFNNSSAQSGKQLYQPGMQTGYAMPFLAEGIRQLTTPQHQMMDYSSPGDSGQFNFGRTGGIQQSNGFDPRGTNMNRTNQNIMGSSQFQQNDQQNQAQFFGAQMSREIDVEIVRSNMSALIKDTGHRTANSFLKDYDTYEGRNFETWELMSIFRLSSQQVRALLKQTDPDFNQRCNLKSLCQELKLVQVQVDVQGYIGTSSEYKERFNRSALQSEFKALARFLLESEFTPNGSSSYREAFLQIKKNGKSGQQDLEITTLRDLLDKKCGKIINQVQQGRFIEYLQINRNSTGIKEVQFVHAMRQILPDQKIWDLGDLMQYLKEVQPAQEKDKLTTDSTDPMTPLIEKIRIHLYNKALYNEIDSKFKNQLRLKLKLTAKEADLGDQTVAPMSDLTTFLDSLQHELKLTQKEREYLVARYFVIPQNLPQQEKPPTPPPAMPEISKPVQVLAVPSNQLPKTPSQQLLVPPQPSKDLSHAPSTDSLARDSVGESKQTLPLVFNNSKAPVTNQEEGMEEEIYEDDDDFDESRAPGDPNNEADKFEGGAKESIQKWFSLQKFKADMTPTKDMLDSKLTYSRRFKFEVLQSMKGWVALTGGSITDLFKLQDKKGTLFATKKQLKQVLQKIMTPKLVTEQHINSVLEFFARVNDQGHICVEYMQLYQFFYKYAKLNVIEETDPKYTYLKELHDLTNHNEMQQTAPTDQKDKKSIAKLLGLTDFMKKPKDQPIEVEIGVLFQVFQKIRLRLGTMRRGTVDIQRFNYEKEIRELLQVHDNKFSIVQYQDIMGYIKEEEPQFSSGNEMRQLCSSLQMGGVSVEMMRHILGKQNQMQRFMNDLYLLLQSHGIFDGSSDLTQQIGGTIENLAMSLCVGSQINAAKFLGKIELEMHKMITLEHFYIKVKAEMRASNVDLAEVFIRYGADSKQREISRENLLQMLKAINMIGEEDNGEFQYFIDEYDSEENFGISLKLFEDDFEEFVGGQESYLEVISQKVLTMIMMVSSQYHQSDLVATLNTAFESQPSNKIRSTWMQNYDFSRWFQVAIIESQYQNFDQDLIELFLLFTNACDNSQQKMINVPNLLKKIAELHQEARTENLKRQLAVLSVKILQNRIIDELQKRNQKPEQYFQGRSVPYFEFERMLSNGPFNLQTLELNSTIQEISDLYKRGSSDIMLEEFVYELSQLFDVTIRRSKLFQQIRHSLEEKGQDIYTALKMIKGQLGSSTHLSISEFTALIQIAEVKDADQQTVVVPIFEHFEVDSHGEVSTDQFLQEFEAATKAKNRKQVTFQSGGKSLLSTAGVKTLEPKNKPIVARRNYKTLDQCLHGIAREIEDRQLRDFGSFLKGYDFKHTDYIESNDFFKVLSELFKEQVLGKGDILDLISNLDPNQTGKIDIRIVAEELNRLINNPDFRVVLQSRVDEAIQDKIFDEIEESNQKKNLVQPKFMHQFVLDLFCGLHVRKQSMLSEWLAMFSRQEDGFLSLIEFTASVEKLDVTLNKNQKKAVFDYLQGIEKTIEREQEQIKIGLVPNQLIVDTFSQVLPQNNLHSLVTQVTTKICLYLDSTKTPIQDCCAKFELTEGSGEISYVDFTHGLLQQELNLEQDISRNMIEILQIFFNPERAQVFSFQPFINLVKQISFDEGLKIFLTQEEVEFDEREQLGNTEALQNSNFSKRVPPKAEASYEARSNKNTYFNGESFASPMRDPFFFKLNDEIITSTRQKGVSVEKHFQGFGRFSPQDGLRHLDLRDFKEALSALNISWAERSETTSSLYRQIEELFSAQTITLEMIGKAVYFNSNVNLLQEEAQVLELVHRELYANGLLSNVEEVFNFHNFTKDGCQTSSDFQKMLINNFRLKGKVSDQNIGLLTQRYRVATKDDKQQVFAFRFVEDLAYQHLNIGILDSWASKIIEQIIKQLQVKLVVDAKRQALNDDDTFDEVRQFFVRNCQQSRDEIFFEDIYRTFSYLQIIDEADEKSKQKVDNFFKLCSLSATGDIRSFKSNSVNPAAIELPISIKLNHFFNALQVLGRKPLTCLYQDVLLQVYFSSKKRGVSIHGPDLINLFIQDDVSHSGQVPLKIFTDKLLEKIIYGRQNVTEQDLVFLATKYISKSGSQQQMICYTQFLDDYQDTDTNQVNGKLSLIFSPNDRAKNRELQVRFTDLETGVKGFKTIESLPEDQRPFFAKMSKYLAGKDLDEILCIEMINRDQTREGFITSSSIKDSLKKIGIPVSQNQLQQLVSVLQTDKFGSFSYLELISILFGLRYMQRVQSENGLWSDKEKANHKPAFDLSKLQISQRLIDQLELRLMTINQLAASMSKTKNVIRDQEVFALLKKAEIDFDSVDLEAIQIYIRERRDPKTNLINLTVMLKHFKVGEETSALLYQIQQQLQNKDLNSLTSQPQLTFIDFKAMLARSGVNVPKQGNVLERLFKQISQQKPEVSRATLLRSLQYQVKETETLQLPKAPPQVNELMLSLRDKQVDLNSVFSVYTVSNRVPVQKFDAFLIKHGLKPSNIITNFFKGTHGDLNLQQIQAYYELSLLNSSPKAVELSVEDIEQKFKAKVGELPQDIKTILERFVQLLERKRMDTAKLFSELDSNGNGLVEALEFDAYCSREGLNVGFLKASIQRLFSYLDSTGDGSVSINELCMLIKSCKLTTDERLASAFTKEFLQELVSEIITLFDRLDTDKNRWLTAQELVIIFKNDGPSNNLSLEQAKQVIDAIDKDSNGRISKEEFVSFILNRQKQFLLEMDDQLQDLRDVFSSLVNIKSGFGVQQHLSQELFKKFLEQAGLQKVTDQEANDLFAQIDTNQSGTIDIDEIIRFVTQNENIVGSTGTTLLSLRKKRAKLNQIDMFDFICLLPVYLQPSFTQRYIENQREGRLSNSLIPSFDFTQFKFGDLGKVKMRTQLGNREFIAQHKPNFGFEFTVTEIKGVPNIAKELVLDESQNHFEIRYFLFDAARQTFCSSVLISHARVQPQKQATKGFVPSYSWCVEDSLKTICLRGSENWHLVIELVAFDQRDKSRQITAGWTSCPLTVKAGRTKLPLRGGSPFNTTPPEIVTSENQVKVKSGITKLFSSNKPPVVERHVVIEIQPFFKLEEKLQADLASMPENTIFFKNILGFASNFRTYCSQKLLKCELLMEKPKGDLVLAQFGKIYDSPDVSAAIAEHWQKLSQSDNGKDKTASVKKVIQRVYALINDGKFGFDHAYPTRSTTADKLKIRMEDLKQCLLQEKPASPPQPQKTVSAITFNEDYQPFSMNELSFSLV